MINSVKNQAVNLIANEIGLYTTSSLVGSITATGYQYTVTDGGVDNTVFGLFGILPSERRYIAPILPH